MLISLKQLIVKMCIGYSIFCVGNGIYIRGSRAPECLFHNSHKTLYNLLSTDPAVSCVAEAHVSHSDMCTHVAFCCISFRSVHMGQMNIISSIFVRYFFQTYHGCISLITCYRYKYVLKRVSFGSKECIKELKPECAYFLGQIS